MNRVKLTLQFKRLKTTYHSWHVIDKSTKKVVGWLIRFDVSDWKFYPLEPLTPRYMEEILRHIKKMEGEEY